MDFSLLTIIVALLLVGENLLLAKLFNDFSWSTSSMFLAPAALLGAALGAFLVAVSPWLRERFHARIYEAVVIAGALSWLALPFHREEALNANAALLYFGLAFSANGLLGAALARLLQTTAPSVWWLKCLLGAALALGLLPALAIWTAPLVTLLFFVGTGLVLGWMGLRRTYSLALTLGLLLLGLFVNGLKAPPGLLASRNSNIQIEKVNQPIPGFRVEINHRAVGVAWDPETSKEIEFLKNEELFGLLGLATKGRIAVVNSLGGSEILQARLSGFKKIDVIESTLAVREVLRKKLRRPELTYSAAEVTLHETEPRFFFRRLATDQKFDAIVLNGDASGSYMLTREGVGEMASHLNPRGILILRFTAESPDFLSRLESSLLAGLGDERESEGEQLLRIGRDGVSATTFAYRKRGFAQVKRGLDRLKDRFKWPMNFTRLDPTASLMDWPRALNDDRPYAKPLSFAKALLAVLSLVAGLILLGLMRLKAGPLLAGSYLAGMGALGLELMALEWVHFASGGLAIAPMGVLLAALASAGLGLWRARRRSDDDRKSVLSALYLRAVLSAILAFYLVRHINELDLSPWAIFAVGAFLCAVPVFFAAQGWSIQLLLIKPGGERATAYVIASHFLGLVLGMIIVKLVALVLGQAAAVAAVVGFLFLASVVFSEEKPSPFAGIPISLPG